MADNSAIEGSIRSYLAERGGSVEDAAGRGLTDEMARALGVDKPATLSALLQQMEQDGVITRDMRGLRTYRIALVAGAQPAAAPPPSPSDMADAAPSPGEGTRAMSLREALSRQGSAVTETAVAETAVTETAVTETAVAETAVAGSAPATTRISKRAPAAPPPPPPEVPAAMPAATTAAPAAAAAAAAAPAAAAAAAAVESSPATAVSLRQALARNAAGGGSPPPGDTVTAPAGPAFRPGSRFASPRPGIAPPSPFDAAPVAPPPFAPANIAPEAKADKADKPKKVKADKFKIEVPGLLKADKPPKIKPEKADRGDESHAFRLTPEVRTPPSKSIVLAVMISAVGLIIVAAITIVVARGSSNHSTISNTVTPSNDACNVVTRAIATAALGKDAGPPSFALGTCIYQNTTQELLVVVYHQQAQVVYNQTHTAGAQSVPGLGQSAYYVGGSLWVLQGTSIMQITETPVGGNPPAAPSPIVLAVANAAVGRLSTF